MDTLKPIIEAGRLNRKQKPEVIAIAKEENIALTPDLSKKAIINLIINKRFNIKGA